MIDRRGERGFTMIEILIGLFIVGMVSTIVLQMLQIWTKATVRIAVKARRTEVKMDLRRLYETVREKYHGGGYLSAGPWPEQAPYKRALPWERPAPGFDSLPWAPSTSPTHLQYRVDGWATGFNVSALGDLDKDGLFEMYLISGDVGMFEGPLPPPAAESSPIAP